MNLPCREKSGIADPLQTEAFCIDGSNNALSRIMMQFLGSEKEELSHVCRHPDRQTFTVLDDTQKYTLINHNHNMMVYAKPSCDILLYGFFLELMY